MPFTCENRRYQTNVDKGFEHGPGNPRGSVFDTAVFENDGYSLWLEHVIEPKTGEEVFWLMWYDPSGNPTIRASGVFNRDDFKQIVGKLTEFV
jgi:hypothetical protein